MAESAFCVLGDGSQISVEVHGDVGPWVMTCARTTVMDGAQAEQMRAWGADPNLGYSLVEGLVKAGFRVVSADYEGHLAHHPQPDGLTAAAVASDLSAIAAAVGAARFAYYGYSWLALAGLQLALRNDAVVALAMGGFPPLGGPYEAMLTVTAATHRMALQAHSGPVEPARAGDWDSVQVTQTPEQTRQYLTLYQSLAGFDDRASLALGIPGLAFAGTEDNISYGSQWGNAQVDIAEPLRRNQRLLGAHGWSVAWVPEADHMQAMQADQVLPILVPWLRRGES